MDKNSANILIVDDDSLVTKTLGTLLSIENYVNVELYNKPEDALEYLKIQEVDLILSDFIMPNMNGIEFLRKAKEIQPNTTQILLTGYADKENAILAINELNIFKYIEKPWHNSDLLNSIRNGIERSQLKKQLDNKIKELETANSKLNEYSKNLEKMVEEKAQEIIQANAKLQTIFDNCADGIVIFDKNNKIISTNSKAESLFGENEENLIGKNFFEIVINEKNQKIYETLKENKLAYLRDFSLIDYKDEKKIPIEISLSSVQNELFNFYIAVIHDVTYQKETERLRDDFMATLTHDLRTPLLAAINGLEFILNKSLGDINDKQELLLSTMKSSNEDMLGLVNALLEVYRYESGKLFLCKTQFCINSLIKKCTQELTPLLEDRKIVYEFESEEFVINADVNEIRRVLTNLISNAIKHSENADKIVISTKKQEKNALIEVRDNGIGLSEADSKNLFKRFSQGTSHKRTCSTGLGLYLSRQIVEAHNGKIWVETELNKGCTFKFELKNAIVENRVLI